MGVLGDERPQPTELAMVEAFNYGMAEWGASHRLPVDFFCAVLQDIESEDEIPGKNHCHALAIAAWAAGDQQRANSLWQRAFELSNSDPAATFSALRYLQVHGEQFRSDLSDVKRMIDGEEVWPPVLAENWVQSHP